MAILSAGLNLPQGGDMQYEFYSGGTSYWVNVFYTGGTLIVPVQKTGCVIWMIGGGGSGAGGQGDQDTGKGGGGAGGGLLHTNYTLTANATYPIFIGNGGIAHKRGWNNGDSQRYGTDSGCDTRAFGVVAVGGGAGGGSDNNRRSHDGGCGGGGGARNSNSGWNNGGVSTQLSYSGFTRYGNSGGSSQNYNGSGGGGGGCGGVGGNQNGSANSTGSTGGNGGAGVNMSSYFGTRVGHNGWFGGGGGGGTYRHGTNSQYQAPPNNGGSNFGGGGYGTFNRESNQNQNIYAAQNVDAMNGTGGGGGGSSEYHRDYRVSDRINGSTAGNGGSGCVIVRCTI